MGRARSPPPSLIIAAIAVVAPILAFGDPLHADLNDAPLIRLDTQTTRVDLSVIEMPKTSPISHSKAPIAAVLSNPTADLYNGENANSHIYSYQYLTCTMVKI